MSSPTPSHIRVPGTDFQLGPVTVPLKKTTSFEVNHKTHTIDLHCMTGEYKTTFRLYLETTQKLNNCIRLFMGNSKMPASLLRIYAVIPVILPDYDTDKKMMLSTKKIANVSFFFNGKEEMDSFVSYYAPLFPGFEVNRNDDEVYRCIHLSSKEKGSETDQIKKLNDAFQRITESRMGDSGLSQALSDRKDSLFPSKPTQYEAKSEDWSREYSRHYEVKSNEISEIIQMGNKNVSIKPTQKEIEAWLANPAELKGQGQERFLAYLKNEWNKPNNNEALKPLLNDALDNPAFNLRDVMYAQFMQDTNRTQNLSTTSTTNLNIEN